MLENDRRRPPSSQRGYGQSWPRIRAEVLLSWNIPLEFAQEHGIDVDHHPPWPSRGRDHAAYYLLPVPHEDHARKTRRQVLAGHKAGWRSTIPEPGQLFASVDLKQPEKIDINSW